DPSVAQRVWYTLLFVGAALAAVAFVAALRMGPAAAIVGAAVYLLNPYMSSVVVWLPEYIAAMALLAALPALLLAVGTGRLSVRWGVVLLALSSPVVGYVFFNPPLVGMIAFVVLATPILAGWIDGRQALIRSSRAL